MKPMSHVSAIGAGVLLTYRDPTVAATNFTALVGHDAAQHRHRQALP